MEGASVLVLHLDPFPFEPPQRGPACVIIRALEAQNTAFQAGQALPVKDEFNLSSDFPDHAITQVFDDPDHLPRPFEIALRCVYHGPRASRSRNPRQRKTAHDPPLFPPRYGRHLGTEDEVPDLV